ncbi:MAG: alpha-ketoglutarate decarboxylase [Flavobacteriaceae bacterium]|nr:alpha-ketoglutarate decarboxylase [Flavobacteriaceae bacterium]
MKRPSSFLLFFCTLLLSLFSFSALAQEPDAPSPFWSKVRFGGGIGASFSNGFFSGTLAPSAIYEVNQQFALGIGLNGTYNSLENEYRSTILGGSVITLFNVIPELQLSAEFEELNVNRNFDDRLGLEDDNYWYPALFVGAGFRSNNFTFGIRYDVLYDDERSIYADPWAPFVRVYF